MINATLKRNLATSFAGVLLLAATAANAQYSSIRLVPKEAKANEGNGYTKNSAAAGYGRVALGSPDATNLGNVATGAVYLWDVKTSAQQATVYPPASDAVAGMDFGAAVAISGKHLVVGAPGAAKVYVFDVNTRALLKTISSGSFVVADGFGAAVAIDRDQVAIGAPFNDVSGADAGSAVVYNMLTAAITSAKPVGATTPLSASANYGASVALRNGVLAVGAPGAEIAYLLDAGATDSYLSEMEDSAGTVGDRFGDSVVFLGQLDLAISAPLDGLTAVETGGSARPLCGSVTRFEISDTTTPTFVATDYGLNNGDKFGAALAGAPYQLYAGMSDFDAGLTDSGAVAPLGGSTLSPAASVAGDKIGSSVAYADAVVVATSPGDDTKGANAGALWILKGPRPLTIGFPSNPTYILKGDTAAGAGQTVFSGFTGISVPQSDDFDLPVYFAKLSGLDTSSGRTTGIWGWDTATVAPLALAVTGATSDLAANSLVGMVNNVSDTTWFRGKKISNGKIALCYNQDGVLTKPIEVGGSLGGKTIAKILEGRADNVAQVAAPGLYSLPLTFSGLAKTADSGIWTSDGSEIQEGTAVNFVTTSGTVNLAYGQIPSRICFSGSTLVFATPLVSAGNPVTTADNVGVVSGTNLLLRKGSPAPGTTGTFSTFLGETLDSDSGVSLIRATIAGAGITSATNEGLWTDRTDPDFTLLLRKGVQAPGLAAGVVVKKIVNYYITTFGDVVTLVAVGGPGITAANDQVLYYNRTPGGLEVEPGTFEILLQEGNRIPGQDNAKVGSITLADYTTRTHGADQSSYYGVVVTLVNETGGATTANNLAWLVGDAALGTTTTPSSRLPQVMLRKGLIAEAPAGKQTISSMTFLTKPIDKSGAGNTGYPHIISAGARTSSLIVTYPDKSQGIISLYNPAESP